MISKLSYLNLTFSVLYFLQYLQNSNSYVISGLLAVVLFNWMALRSQEKERFEWTVLHWFTALLSLSFAVFTGYTAVTVLIGSMEYRYYPFTSLMLIAAGILFTAAILFHLYLSLNKSIRKKSDQLFDN